MQTIEALPTGDCWRGQDYLVCRYRDGWYFLWHNSVHNKDVGRFFDEDHIWEMRNFMQGKWNRGTVIGIQKSE